VSVVVLMSSCSSSKVSSLLQLLIWQALLQHGVLLKLQMADTAAAAAAAAGAVGSFWAP
jgi:hypothetical protein